MNDRVPINFEHQGKHYSGYFHSVAGAGSSQVWHLMIDNYYWGRLRISDRWVFDSAPNPDISNMADYFGDYMTAWYG